MGFPVCQVMGVVMPSWVARMLQPLRYRQREAISLKVFRGLGAEGLEFIAVTPRMQYSESWEVVFISVVRFRV